MSCPFCNIDKEKNRVITEKKHVYVMFSNPRLMSCHIIVIPKRHVEKLSELNKEERSELFNTAIEFQEKILSIIASGYDITQHCRPFLPESKLKVNHVHIHLKPRELKDELYQKVLIFEKELFKDLPQEEIEKFSKLLDP